MEPLWLGYDGLTITYTDVVAVLFYTPLFDTRIIRAYGHVPPAVRAIVVLDDGRYLPSQWSVEQLRQRVFQLRHSPPPEETAS